MLGVSRAVGEGPCVFVWIGEGDATVLACWTGVTLSEAVANPETLGISEYKADGVAFAVELVLVDARGLVDILTEAEAEVDALLVLETDTDGDAEGN